MRSVFTLFYLFFSVLVYSQDSASTFTKTDTTHYYKIINANHKVYPYNKKRVHLVTAGNIIGYGSVLIGFNSAWYSKYPRSKFHFFNDNDEWLQVDKAGHIYGAYIQSYGSYEMWRWTGISRKKEYGSADLAG